MLTSGKSKNYSLPITVVLLLFGIVTLTIYNWKDMNAEMPPFNELKVVKANSFRSDLEYGMGKSSIEFYDNQGNRFQTPGLGNDERQRLRDALERDVPVNMYYGRWDSPWPSKKIFSVYQLAIGDTILIPYSRLAAASENKKKYRYLTIVLSTVIMVGATTIGLALGLRARRHETTIVPL